MEKGRRREKRRRCTAKRSGSCETGSKISRVILMWVVVGRQEEMLTSASRFEVATVAGT